MSETRLSRKLQDNIDLYSIIGWLAMLAVPIAPAFFFGFSFAQEVYGQVLGFTANTMLAGVTAVTIGFVSAFGLESVGILSGHNAVKFWGQGENEKALLSVAILVAYVALGIIGLEGLLSKGVVMFSIAPLVYFQVAIQKDAEVKRADKLSERSQSKAWEQRQKEREAEYKHQERLARIQAKTVRTQPVRSAESSGKFPSDYRKLTPEQERYLSELTREERENELSHLSGRTFRNWNEKLDQITVHKNGKVKEAS